MRTARAIENRRAVGRERSLAGRGAIGAAKALALSLCAILSANAAFAVSDPYLGEVITVGSDFCPAGFMQMNGQLLDTGTYEQLYILIGTKYGDDGLGTFRLPTLAPTRTATGERVLFCIAVDGSFTFPSAE